jgi:site-specific DNA recombinase
MRYVIYARKSTEEEDRQVLSIESQLEELRLYSAKEKFDIVASFEEAKTAKEPGRMKFAEMLSFIESGKADGIVSWHPDRLARNSVDGGKIIHMVDRGLIRSLKFPTFWFEPTPQGLFMLNIAFGQSKYFVDNLRENVKRGLRQKIRNGVWPGRAPVGYENNPKTRGIDVDKEKAEKVRKLFELYATGEHTLYSLASWCKEHNLRGHGSELMRVGNIQKNLQNIFYIGLMKWKEEIFEGTHEPILTKKLFDKVQEVMKKKGRTRPDKKHIFPLRGLLKCASCGCAITAQYAKGNGGIYAYYRCTKKRGACAERYVSEQNLTNQIRSFLQKVSLSSQDTQKVLAALEADEAQAKQEARSEAENLKSEMRNLDNHLEKLLNLYLADALSTAEYAAKKNKIISERSTMAEKVADIEQRGVSWLEPAREFVLSLNQAANLLSRNDVSGMTAFLKNIGANHSLRNRTFEFSPKTLVARAAESSEAASADLRFPFWCRGWDSNPQTLSGQRF